MNIPVSFPYPGVGWERMDYSYYEFIKNLRLGIRNNPGDTLKDFKSHYGYVEEQLKFRKV